MELSEWQGSAGGGDDVDPIELAVEELAVEGIKATVEDRLILLSNPMGSPHVAVLQALGAASRAAVRVGAAAHGTSGVAAAVWLAPELYVARWTGANRWVAGYRFPARARPDAYVREESGHPQPAQQRQLVRRRARRGQRGVLLRRAAPRRAAVPGPGAAPAARAPGAGRLSSAHGGGAPRPRRRRRRPGRPARRPRPGPPRPAKVTTVLRSCPGCNLSKHPSQFVAGSDLCVDCR